MQSISTTEGTTTFIILPSLLKGDNTMKWQTKAVLLFSVAIIALSTVACEKEGDAEKAGKEIDKALSTAKEKINDATK